MTNGPPQYDKRPAAMSPPPPPIPPGVTRLYEGDTRPRTDKEMGLSGWFWLAAILGLI